MFDKECGDPDGDHQFIAQLVVVEVCIEGLESQARHNAPMSTESTIALLNRLQDMVLECRTHFMRRLATEA